MQQGEHLVEKGNSQFSWKTGPKGTLIRAGPRPVPSPKWQFVAGLGAGLVAVAIRHSLPLSPAQLPTLTVVVLVAVMTLWVGTIAGVTTAVIGGALSWFFFFNPMSWSLANEAWIPLLGFAVIASVIISTSHLYRASERRHHERELTRMQLHAESAEFFAREMAHRLKNALAIVQGIAHQTLGNESDASRKFAARLQTLAEANALLTEDVDNPTADVKAVIETAIRPFREPSRFNINGVSAQISSQQVVSLALALHELCTNASKYGALSVRSGQVFIDVEDAGETLKLVWREQGGPLVSEPATQGFGSRLLLRAGFQTTLHFQPEGLSCKMDVRKA